ncbi:2-dehydro-3-deoxygalactonokinase [Xanthobacter flavus]|uniref:2-dehydro-3-deoxygalactonokinase n=1 Tax=Xanthobacter flavus TaxID=281 RepID=UPI001AE78649|nr:2-dehydro-3-deoxygalactonokinase [Xanthobacter flavus]MBP2152113.1 2-dehydro-3-deoxygalactonokinase [Xanthobacter flavus]
MTSAPITPVLITCDWGTSALRAYLMAADGQVLASRASGQGIMALGGASFPEVLAAIAGDWAREHGPLPVLLSGMVGSRQGWMEAPYARCPAGLPDLAATIAEVPGQPGFGPIAIVPGVLKDDDKAPDVIRGEEVEVLGALARLGISDGLFVLPGTHSKWVRVEAGRITTFATYMTGEVFAALRGHTILGRMMEEGTFSAAGFRRGVDAAAALEGPGALLGRLFSLRTLGLTGRLDGADSADMLSGLLIGAELRDASAGEPFTLVANPALAARYAEAATLLGLPHASAPEGCGPAGQHAVARAAGFI